MDLNNRLKKLNNLPEDRAVKTRIYERIHHKRKKDLPLWKESVLLLTIAMIALFFIMTPQNSSPPQTAGQSIQAIYKHFGGKEGKFFARSSSLYISTEKVEDTIIYNFFKDLTQYVEEADGKLGNHITDVVVVRDRQEERYQISDTGMLNVDSGQFFVGKSEIYDKVFQTLYSAKATPWIFILPLIVVAVNIFSMNYYKRHNLQGSKPSKRMWWLLVLVLAMVSSVFAWATWVGPLYKPLMITFAFLYGVIIWHSIKRDVQTYSIYKVETIKISIISATLVLIIMLY
ncbi:hypothetical protein FJQ98_10840 [Lysinibacillus agricola]|uniref:DUF1189 domain-containing protein n=1 Tax=Lysinibacillus agricola TaxID=2590012 RepID=A0ABX7AXD3_9BACI|nr:MULTISPECIES: hypothetical protein [Lysinibacillus]KOS60170.1 hypothetical protein AN161_23980 [Lysinibacillus sp. FJAT-14222]QQP14459.1 hypothetical protein FJQ98_10840 [Lysinibacillus agricola]